MYTNCKTSMTMVYSWGNATHSTFKVFSMAVWACLSVRALRSALKVPYDCWDVKTRVSALSILHREGLICSQTQVSGHPLTFVRQRVEILNLYIERTQSGCQSTANCLLSDRLWFVYYFLTLYDFYKNRSLRDTHTGYYDTCKFRIRLG